MCIIWGLWLYHTTFPSEGKVRNRNEFKQHLPYFTPKIFRTFNFMPVSSMFDLILPRTQSGDWNRSMCRAPRRSRPEAAVIVPLRIVQIDVVFGVTRNFDHSLKDSPRSWWCLSKNVRTLRWYKAENSFFGRKLLWVQWRIQKEVSDEKLLIQEHED